MPIQVDLDDVLALAPEKKRQDRARKLTLPGKWQNLGTDGTHIWGAAPSSGKNYYSVMAEVSGPIAYRCTCSSREHPCKHTLALLMMAAQASAEFKTAPAPDWVEDWAKRRIAAKQRKASSKPRKVNPKTLARRKQEIESGMDELDLWMRDLIRAGLATAQGKPRSFYTNPARRLIDAKAPALAERVRGLASIKGSGNAWAEQMLTELSQIHLIIEGFRRYDKLTPPLQADIRNAVGWYMSQAELIDEPVVSDTWFVTGIIQGSQDRLKMQRLWMIGLETGRSALLLDFAHGKSDFEHRYSMGDTFQADLAFYPSAYPLRAIVRSRGESAVKPNPLPGYDSLRQSIDTYAAALASNPWLSQFPVAFREVIPVKDGRNWFIVDADGDAMPIASQFRGVWELFTMSGGYPVWLFGEWNGNALVPLSVAQGDLIVSL
jgi:hypothetical protein